MSRFHKRIHKLWPLLAAFVAAGVLAETALAQSPTISPQTLGAAAAIPYLVEGPQESGSQITVATITNGLTETAINLHITFIDDGWQTVNKDCALTPLETTYFIFEDDGLGGGNTKVTLECSDLGVTAPDPSRTNNVDPPTFIGGHRGIMFVALECQKGDPGCPTGTFAPRTRPDNALLADATVIDFFGGSAFSVSAIHIQSNGTNDGDQLYEFDGNEYLSFPSVVTTSYIAPDDDVSLELLLFTLDGTKNDPAPILVNVTAVAYDDDENPTSGGIVFDCLYFEDVTQLPASGFGPNIRGDIGGHLVGHLKLKSEGLSAFDANETNPETGGAGSPGFRSRPFHGWIIQMITAGGDFNDGAFPMAGSSMAGNGVWSRTLGQGSNPFIPAAGDIPALNAR